MHCPKCGQQQASDNVRYCSRCGLLLTGIAKVVANEGVLPGAPATGGGITTPRKQGVKKAAFIFILGIVLVPIWVIFLVATNGPPELAAAAVGFFVAATVLRLAYALLFQSPEPVAAPNGREKPVFPSSAEKTALPPHTGVPAGAYAAPGTGAWRETNDLAEPASVTDNTTKLFSREERGQ